MEYHYLGCTGLQVSEICLGTMQFRWTTDEESSYAVLDAFVEAGGTFIDTADVYSRWARGLVGGEAETILGDWMRRKGNRREVVLATKVRGRMWRGPNGEGLSRAHILRAVDDSLRRLQTDYIDLYQAHSPDEHTPIEETLRVMEDLIRQGKARYAGCSNYNGWQLMEAALTARHLGLAGYSSLQPHYSLVERANYEQDVRPVVHKFGLGVIPYSPLGKGFLTGKYRRGQPLPESLRRGAVQPLLTERNFNLIDRLEALGRGRGKSIAQMALGWLLSQPEVSAVIVGANNPDQLADSLGAAGLRLTEAERKVLDEASAVSG